MHHHYIDRFSYEDSPIHRLDPRAKVLAVIVYTFGLISLDRYTLPSPWFVVLPFAMLHLGNIPLKFVAKHILIVSPFILCVAAFAPWFDCTEIPVGDTTIRGGWLAAATIVLRFVLSMAALIALASTTRFAELLKGLETLGVPRLLVNQLRFLYRYLFLMIDQVMHLRRARQTRDAGRGPRSARWRASAGMIGVLFIRTLEQAERTHMAMASRGYDGTIRIAKPLRWRLHDTMFLVGCVLYVAWIRF